MHFNVRSQRFLKKRERKPKLSKAEKDRAQCVALSSSRARVSFNCSNSATCYKEGTETVSDGKRNVIGVQKAYERVEVHIHFILKLALYGFQWLTLRCNRFNAAEAGWAPQPIYAFRRRGKHFTSAENRTARNRL
jgi:hypothetical protein